MTNMTKMNRQTVALIILTVAFSISTGHSIGTSNELSEIKLTNERNSKILEQINDIQNEHFIEIINYTSSEYRQCIDDNVERPECLTKLHIKAVPDDYITGK